MRTHIKISTCIYLALIAVAILSCEIVNPILQNTDQNRDDWQEIWDNGSHLLTGIHFFDDEYGIAVGYDTENEFGQSELRSVIQYTTNGGRRWQFQDIDYPIRLNSLFFVDDSHGWIPATYGVILHTTDAGESWTVQESNVFEELRSIHFIDSQNGWAVGHEGTITRTTDGGNTWTPQNSGTSQQLNDVFFTSPANGWIVGQNSTVLSTTNGGQSWQQQNIAGGNINAVTFSDPTTGYIVGDFGQLFRTTNSGQSWQRQTFPRLDDYHLLTISFYDQAHGWIGGGFYYQDNQLLNSGVIYHTKDGGLSWENYDSDLSFSQFTSFGANIRDFSFTSPDSGWAAGDSRTCCNSIYNFERGAQ